MFCSIIRGEIHINTDNGEYDVFALDDHAGVLAFLRENMREDEMLLHSSSCDFPEDDGAPPGWSFWKFMDEVEHLAEGVISETLSSLTGDLLS